MSFLSQLFFDALVALLIGVVIAGPAALVLWWQS